MKLPALSPGLTELPETEVVLPFSKKGYVRVSDTIFFRNPFQVKASNRIPLARLIRSLKSTGPFEIKRIILFPTKSICFDIYDKQGKFHRINTAYFTKGKFIERYWKVYWILWHLLSSLRKLVYK